MGRLKKFRIAGGFLAILMIIIGILMFIFPVKTFVFFEYIAIGLLILFGIFKIIDYIEMIWKDGWTLTSGILNIAVGLLLIFSGETVTAKTFSILFSFIVLSWGISQISFYSTLRIKGVRHASRILFAGISNIVLALGFVLMPFLFISVINWVLSFYLIVNGAILLTECSVRF